MGTSTCTMGKALFLRAVAIALFAIAARPVAAQSFTDFATTGVAPQDMVFDASGNLYVTNYGGNTITKITPAGAVSTFATLTGFPTPMPWGIVIDKSGNLYTANENSNTVSKITPAGVITINFAATGFAPHGIAIDASGNLYTANEGTNNVTKITPAGVSGTFATVGTNPVDLAIDASGNLYTANLGSNNVSKITPGGVVTTLGTTGSKPFSIVLDASGNVYTANSGSNTVTKITPAGVPGTFGTTGAVPHGIAIDASGNIYTANYSGNNVTQITPAGVATNYPLTSSVNYGQGIAIGPDNHVYVTAGNTSYLVERSISSVILPITITGFSGVRAPAGNLLSWTAGNAANFGHFELQRGTDGIGFGTIATVALNASGSYGYTDASPAPGTDYYRLAMVDLDGSVQYSKTVAIVGGGGGFAVAGIYPNPTTSLLNIALYAPTAVSVTYTITDISGRVVARETHSAGAATTQQINVGGLARGTYLVTVGADGTKTTSKFTKL